MNEHSCDDIVEQMYRYFDRDVSSEERSDIEAHLRGCSHCLAAFDFEAELKQIVTERGRQPCSSEFTLRLRRFVVNLRAEDPTQR